MLYTKEWIFAFCVATRVLPCDVQEKIFDQVAESYVPPVPGAPRKSRR